MTSATAESILADRHPFSAPTRSWAEALLFEQYVLSREVYKTDLVETLGSLIREGPVLEASGGFGSIGLRLAQLRSCEVCVLCDGEHSRRLCEERRRREQLPVSHYRPEREFPREAFELAYSINVLHEWDTPEQMLRRLFGYVRPGGNLVINDLRRDSNPYITEYVIREMAGDETLAGLHHLSTFLSSLRSAYTAAELALLLERARLGEFSLSDDEPMTLTATIRKRG